MNPLFTLGEEFRFHDSSRFRKKAGDAKLPFYHSFVPVLMSLAAESCRSRAESVHLLKPYLQWGKGWKNSNFVTPDDSARNRKMMSLNCSICLMPIFGVGKVYRIWTPKGGPPQFSTWMFVSSFLSFVVSWFLSNFWSSWVRSERHVAIQKQDCHTLQRVDLARPFLVSPAIKIEIENSLEMALSKAKSGSAWQSHFWQCGTLRPARNTKLFRLRK